MDLVCLEHLHPGLPWGRMKPEIYKNPELVDFMLVMDNLQADEIRQFEAFTGETFNPQRAAAFYSLRDGPKWLLAAEGRPIAVAGFDMLREGVWQDWLFSTPEVWKNHWRYATKACRGAMDAMLQTCAHRLQCVSLASRVDAHRWYRPLGYIQEGILRGYAANGEDAIMFSRIK